MPLFVCGINHKTAPIALRERLVFQDDVVANALSQLIALPAVEEAVILSTCHRTEVYFVSDDPAVVYDWLLGQCQEDVAALRLSLYLYSAKEAVTHAMRVACGLDSMVIGEPQILGQFKTAFSRACENGAVSVVLSRLFPRVFSVAKRVRTHTAIGACPVSLASMSVKCAQAERGSLDGLTVLIIGAGQTGALALKYFSEQKIKACIVASRRMERSQALAAKYGAVPIDLSMLIDVLPRVDLVVSATSSPVPLLTKSMLDAAFTARAVHPLLLIDIAVPRDIAADVRELPYVTLYCIDDLQKIIQQNMQDRQHAAVKAEEMLRAQAESFMRWQESLGATTVIKAYREHVMALRDHALNQSLKLLRQGEDPETVLVMLAHRLSMTFMHKPSVNLKKAGYDGRFDLIELTHQLFDIK